jgi:hypothetical protein
MNRLNPLVTFPLFLVPMHLLRYRCWRKAHSTALGAPTRTKASYPRSLTFYR